VLDTDGPAARMGGMDTLEKHFLRVCVNDLPGVLSRITGILGEHGISIASVIQHDPSGASGAAVPLVIMTHACSTAAVERAVAHIDASDVVSGKTVCLSVLDE
jgi:homoserine dehydrogenase